MEAFTVIPLLVSSSIHRQASILRRGPQAHPIQAVLWDENIFFKRPSPVNL